MGIFGDLLTKLENFGYKTANFTHKFTVTVIALGSVYGFFMLGRDYRRYFKARKTEEYAASIKKREEIMRKLIEAKEKKENS